MKARIYGFRFLIALMAFTFGISTYSMRQYFQVSNQLPQTVSKKTEPISPVIAALNNIQIDEVKEKVEPEFYAGGDYFIIGKLPKGFEDFEYLQIETDRYDEKSDSMKLIVPEGLVHSNKKFEFSKIYINNKKISFETESHKGISYKFTGTFIESEANKTFENEPVNLEGQLIKMRDGKKIAEITVNLAAYNGC